ncbi:MAG: hypothetical protein MUQ10_06155, partial [Anaerolineae bacterium]|nr:hypothetical protein [Anaerolineae bacterium]
SGEGGVTMMDERTADQGLWIAGGGTDNPTLMYDWHPMLKLGPMPELAVFSLGIGSSVLNHELWFDWLVDHDFGYARVYPESGYIWCDLQADGRLYPFVVDHWDADHPVVDLFHLDPDYWRNFDRVLQACAERDIVVHLQLYQRCYLMPGDAAWSQSYYHPANNVNGVDTSADGGRSGYGLWQKTIDDYPDGPLWCIHRAWVQRILSAVGHNRNVIIDLVNEAGDREGFGMVKPWVERTLDIIEEWERETGCSVLKGLFVALWDDQEYLLSHPRLDVAIYHERHMIGKEDRDIVQDRQHYCKPAISVHNGPFRR